MKIVAQHKATGLYFNGTNFGAQTTEAALGLRPGTTSADFQWSWEGEIVVLRIPECREDEDRLALAEHGAVLRADLEQPEAAIQRIKKAQNNLPEDPAFVAFTTLQHVGPANDWNGLRSAAQNLQIKWCIEILTPACEQVKAAQNP